MNKHFFGAALMACLLFLCSACGGDASPAELQEAEAELTESNPLVIDFDTSRSIDTLITDGLSPYDWSVDVEAGESAVDILLSADTVTPDWTFADVVFMAMGLVDQSIDKYGYPLGTVEVSTEYEDGGKINIKRWTTTDLSNGEFFSLDWSGSLTLEDLAERCEYEPIPAQ